MRKTKNYSDKELVEGCIRNDRTYQEFLYRKYFVSMMQMCSRYTSDKDKAMEIVNDGFLRVFKKIDKYTFRGSLEGWIRKLVFHSLSEYFKKSSKYIQFLDFEDRDQSIRSNALQNMFVEDLMKMVEELPPATKNVFKMYALDGYSHVEIAKEIGISIGTSKWHLASARSKLKALLEKYNQNSLANHAG